MEKNGDQCFSCPYILGLSSFCVYITVMSLIIFHVKCLTGILVYIIVSSFKKRNRHSIFGSTETRFTLSEATIQKIIMMKSQTTAKKLCKTL